MLKTKKTCITYGCRNIHTNRSGFCDVCEARRKAQWEREAHRDRSACKRGYDAEWTKFARTFLKAHPVCAMCGQPAKVVDHILPAKIMMDAFGKFDYDERYYQALCFKCNNRKGAREDKEMIDDYLKDKHFLQNQGEGPKKSDTL